MDQLMNMMFGKDYLEYCYDDKKICQVRDDIQPTFEYKRDEWTSSYRDMLTSDDTYMSEEGNVLFTLSGVCLKMFMHVVVIVHISVYNLVKPSEAYSP